MLNIQTFLQKVKVRPCAGGRWSRVPLSHLTFRHNFTNNLWLCTYNDLPTHVTASEMFESRVISSGVNNKLDEIKTIQFIEPFMIIITLIHYIVMPALAADQQ